VSAASASMDSDDDVDMEDAESLRSDDEEEPVLPQEETSRAEPQLQEVTEARQEEQASEGARAAGGRERALSQQELLEAVREQELLVERLSGEAAAVPEEADEEEEDAHGDALFGELFGSDDFDRHNDAEDDHPLVACPASSEPWWRSARLETFEEVLNQAPTTDLMAALTRRGELLAPAAKRKAAKLCRIAVASSARPSEAAFGGSRRTEEAPPPKRKLAAQQVQPGSGAASSSCPAVSSDEVAIAKEKMARISPTFLMKGDLVTILADGAYRGLRACARNIYGKRVECAVQATGVCVILDLHQIELAERPERSDLEILQQVNHWEACINKDSRDKATPQRDSAGQSPIAATARMAPRSGSGSSASRLLRQPLDKDRAAPSPRAGPLSGRAPPSGRADSRVEATSDLVAREAPASSSEVSVDVKSAAQALLEKAKVRRFTKEDTPYSMLKRAERISSGRADPASSLGSFSQLGGLLNAMGTAGPLCAETVESSLSQRGRGRGRGAGVKRNFKSEKSKRLFRDANFGDRFGPNSFT